MENNIITGATQVEKLTKPKKTDFNWPTNNPFLPNINLDNKFYQPNEAEYIFKKTKDE